MTATMRAVVVTAPGGPEVLQLRDVPVPQPKFGEILIRVEAFGLNRSELHFRRGQATSGSFPRIPGIEATGVVAIAPGSEGCCPCRIRAEPFVAVVGGGRVRCRLSLCARGARDHGRSAAHPSR